MTLYGELRRCVIVAAVVAVVVVVVVVVAVVVAVVAAVGAQIAHSERAHIESINQRPAKPQFARATCRIELWPRAAMRGKCA